MTRITRKRTATLRSELGVSSRLISIPTSQDTLFEKQLSASGGGGGGGSAVRRRGAILTADSHAGNIRG